MKDRLMTYARFPVSLSHGRRNWLVGTKLSTLGFALKVVSSCSSRGSPEMRADGRLLEEVSRKPAGAYILRALHFSTSGGPYSAAVGKGFPTQARPYPAGPRSSRCPGWEWTGDLQPLFRVCQTRVLKSFRMCLLFIRMTT